MHYKYLVRGGWVYSNNDGDRHYIRGRDLVRLYNVHPVDCLVLDYESEYDRIRTKEKLMGRNVDNLIVLDPDYSGKYLLPNGQK